LGRASSPDSPGLTTPNDAADLLPSLSCRADF
jgi:hypothetical protein